MSAGQTGPAVGVAVAATGGLYLTVFAVAPLSVLLLPFVPLPGLLLGGRHGTSPVAVCVALSALLAAVLLGLEPALTFVLAIGAPTLATTIALRRGWSVERTVVVGTVAWSVAIALLLMVAYGSPAEVIAGLRARIGESFDLALAMSTRVGMATDVAADLAAGRDTVIDSVLQVVPGALVLAGAFTMLLNVLIVRHLLPWLQVADLRTWSAPSMLIWAFIVAGFGMFAPVRDVGLIARNAFLILMGCYFCQGVAVVSFYLERFRLRRGLRIATYVLLMTQQLLMLVVLLLGVFDLWANFRRVGVAASAETDV